MLLLRRRGDELQEYRFEGEEMTRDALAMFLKQKTHLYLNLPGCLRKFDSLARWYNRATTDELREKVLRRTEEEADAEGGGEDRKRAGTYLRMMRLLHQGGEGALREEEARLRGDLKVGGELRVQAQEYLNIIRSFDVVEAEPYKPFKPQAEG